MAATTTIDRESVTQEGFYVPRFEVHVNGVGLPQDVIRDVISLTYKDSIKEIDSFEMTVANWDPVEFDHKYIGARTETKKVLDDKSSHQSQLFHLFEPCNHAVEVKLGYAGTLRTMLSGNFTTMEPSFTNSGAPILTVRGLNVLHQLRRKQYTTAFAGKKPSEIAVELGNLRDKGQKRFPLPVKIDDQAKADEDKIDIVTQKNQYDVDFLFVLARSFGYVVYVIEADTKKGIPRSLYFGPSDSNHPGTRDVTFQLERGKSIIDFKPKLTTANQIKSVTVRGWHRTRKTLITRTVTLDDERINVNKDLHRILNACDAREELVVDEPIFTNCEARERAIAILLDQSKQMVTATVRVVGLPDLRAGQIVVIGNVGARLSGRYFVTKSKHTIDDNGYITEFDCRREQYVGGGTP